MREATPADAAALAAFAAHLFTRTYALGGSGPVARSRPEDVAAHVAAHFSPEHQRAELADPAVVTFLAEVADRGAGPDGFARAAGYAQLRLGPSAAAPTPGACAGPHPRELARLYVDPPWHGRGVADRLVDAVEARAEAAGGADPLWLAVYQENARAVAFYQRRGFAVVGDASFAMGDETQRDWLMARRLTAPRPSVPRPSVPRPPAPPAPPRRA